MASSLCRLGSSVLRRTLFYSSISVRAGSHGHGHHDKEAYESDSVKAEVEKKVGKGIKVPDGWVLIPGKEEEYVGLEKGEYYYHLKGDNNPFHMEYAAPPQPGLGTRENPNIVPTYDDGCRMIGCLCDEDAIGIKFTTVYEGIPGRCECGKWFKLERAEEWKGR